MALRIFGRKTTTRRTATADSSTNGQAADAEPKPRRRRRTTSSASPDGATAKAEATNVEAPATETPRPATRTRRGRRGGVGRKPKAKVDAAAPAAAPEPAPIVPLRREPAERRGPATIEQLMEQQVAALTALERSLAAINSHLGGAGQVRGAAAPAPRVGIFVDVPNVIYAAERQRVTLDYKKVLEFIVGGRELVRASAYSPISDDPQAKMESSRFVQPFVGRGYRFVTKPYKRYADGSMKANFDVELAIDVLTMSDKLDIVTLVSGDGDFRRLVELVASKGVRVEVVAFGNSTAAELRAIADEYIDLNDHIAELRAK